MGEKPSSDWSRTLGDIEGAIERCLDSLARYERKFDETLNAAPRPGTEPTQTAIDDPNWTTRLQLAVDEVDRAERQIAEQAAAWSRWQGTFANWKNSLERLAGATIAERS